MKSEEEIKKAIEAVTNHIPIVSDELKMIMGAVVTALEWSIGIDGLGTKLIDDAIASSKKHGRFKLN
jgi:hypothetical protein